MAAPVVFTDLYKPVKDFFSKGYNNQSIRFEGKAKGSDATLLATLEHSDKGITTTSEYEQTCKCSKAPGTAKLVINSNGRFQPSYKIKPVDVKGLTVTASADLSTTGAASKADYVEGSAEYVQSQFFAKGAVRPFDQSAEASLTVAISQFLFGASAKANAKGLSGYSAGASYKTPALFFAGTYGSTGAISLGLLYYYKKHAFGGQATLANKNSGEFGWETKCGNTTWKAKINQAQLVSVSAQHKLSRVVATLSGDINPSKAEVSKVGVKFLLEE